MAALFCRSVRGRLTTILGLLAASGLPGCLGPPAVLEPTGPHIPWQTPQADVWVVWPRGCGLCPVWSDHPHSSTTVLYRDGSVLWMAYGSDQEPGQSFKEQARPYQEAVWHVENQTGPYPYRIDEVVTSTLVGDEWTAIRARLLRAMADAHDPGKPDLEGITDWSGAGLRSYGDPAAWRVSVNPAHHEDDEWGYLIGQGGAVRNWITQWKEP